MGTTGGGAGFTYWDLGACNCSFPQTFEVEGCNSLGYSGLTVSVYTASGGTLLASGTTDASGSVSLSWDGTSSPYVTVTGQSTRFAAYGQTLTLTSGGTTTITLTVAAGYVCIPTCLQPIATTLHLTYAGQAYTLTYGAATVCSNPYQWTSAVVNQPNATVNSVNSSFNCTTITGSTPSQICASPNGTSGLDFTLVGYVDCNCSGWQGLTNAAFNSGTGICVTVLNSSVSLACPPSLSVTGGFPASFAAGAVNAACGGSGTTITATPGGGGSFTVTE